jgi:CheY-like chemotaxis protein
MLKVIQILLVEDDNLDVIDVGRTLDKMAILYKMEVARNGEEAVRILSEKTAAGSELPDFIILDINMPKMNGFEFLDALRSRPEWRDLKVFVLTTSSEKEDRQAAKDLGIAGYIVKPLKLNNPVSNDAFNLMIDLMNMRG